MATFHCLVVVHTDRRFDRTYHHNPECDVLSILTDYIPPKEDFAVDIVDVELVDNGLSVRNYGDRMPIHHPTYTTPDPPAPIAGNMFRHLEWHHVYSPHDPFGPHQWQPDLVATPRGYIPYFNGVAYPGLWVVPDSIIPGSTTVKLDLSTQGLVDWAREHTLTERPACWDDPHPYDD